MPDSVALLNNTLILGALLFSLGLVGFMTRRNLIVLFLCAELMLQGVSMTFVAFGKFHGTWGGQIFAIFSLAIAAAEAAIALALIIVLFRRKDSLDVSVWQDLREEDQPPVTDLVAGDEPAAEPQWPHLYPAGRLPAESDPLTNPNAPMPVKMPTPVTSLPNATSPAKSGGSVNPDVSTDKRGAL
jgi:NADH-quinone oxidoreductase subunit K